MHKYSVFWTGSVQVVGAVGWGNASLKIPEHISPPIKQLMLECMERDPEKRPTFEHIIVSLRHIRQTEVDSADSKALSSGKDFSIRAEATAAFAVPIPQNAASEQPNGALHGSTASNPASLKSHRTM